MEADEKNANALNAEQIRQRQQVSDMLERISKIEQQMAALSNDLYTFKALVLPKIMTSGSTSE